jgi:RNA polymerase sigma-70 factor, ECF subfamily
MDPDNDCRSSRVPECVSESLAIVSFIYAYWGWLGMSSSFPAARFPALPFGREREGKADSLHEDPVAGPSKEPSDDVLIARISESDREALGLLFRRYARLVWSVAERIVRNKAEADDLLQDVFLLIERRASVFDPSKGTARTLIVHMTYQCAISRRRYLNARHPQAPEGGQEDSTDDVGHTPQFYDESLESHFGRERLREALDEMSVDQRETLRLFFFEGYTLAEIASELGQAEGNVKHHYYRGLERLRRHMPWKSGR